MGCQLRRLLRIRRLRVLRRPWKQEKNIEDDLGDFKCWKCHENSYDDCSVNGEWEYCDDGQKGCFIEERKRRPKRGVAREVTSVQTGCKQLTACTVQFRYN